MPTAALTARPNCRSRRPVVPGRKATGTKTAPSTSVAATIALVTSPIERRTAAARGSPSPSSRATFSTTTMASSTTRPMASTSAKSVIVLIDRPIAFRTAKVPTSETGIVTAGMSVVRQSCRKT
jgi:hypothetical protein